MAYSWKGAISFGLIYIPISLQVATSKDQISFNQLHKDFKKRIKYKKTCEGCEDSVTPDKIVKGYEYEKDKYVIFTNEDLEKIKTKKDKSIVIEQFVKLSEIDPIYYDKAYYVIPNGAEQAFSLLYHAMKAEKKVGIAKVVLGQRENLVALRINGNKMMLSTLFFYDDIKKSDAKAVSKKVDEKELKIAKSIINTMTEPFDIKKYKDEYKAKLLKAIESKINGKEIVTEDISTENDAVGLMEALQASLKSVQQESTTH